VRVVIGPGMDNYQLALKAITGASDDPENTLQLAITMKEFATVTFGMFLVNTLFPELAFVVGDVLNKLEEVSDAQEFLPKLPEPQDTP
jgi:hypothetical protein